MRYYENPQKTSENRCAPRSYYIPSNPGAYQLLNGIWRFKYYARDIDVQENGVIILKTIDGNSNNQVRVCYYNVNTADGSLIGRNGRLCYIVAPEYENGSK